MKKTARQKCLSAFQELRRLQEADDNGYVTCISSGRSYYWNDRVDGGHFIPRGCKATELEPDNVFPQSKHDNKHLSGNHAAYRRNLVEKIGIERIERLELLESASNGDESAFKQLSAKDCIKAISVPNNQEYDTMAKAIRMMSRQIKKRIPKQWN